MGLDLRLKGPSGNRIPAAAEGSSYSPGSCQAVFEPGTELLRALGKNVRQIPAMIQSCGRFFFLWGKNVCCWQSWKHFSVNMTDRLLCPVQNPKPQVIIIHYFTGHTSAVRKQTWLFADQSENLAHLEWSVSSRVILYYCKHVARSKS